MTHTSRAWPIYWNSLHRCVGASGAFSRNANVIMKTYWIKFDSHSPTSGICLTYGIHWICTCVNITITDATHSIAWMTETLEIVRVLDGTSKQLFKCVWRNGNRTGVTNPTRVYISSSPMYKCINCSFQRFHLLRNLDLNTIYWCPLRDGAQHLYSPLSKAFSVYTRMWCERGMEE